MPSASFERLTGAGHLPQLETPDRVLDQIIDFMRPDDGA
jgi:pimeloyl-ACP methyl ester carboxylesterase